MIYPKWLEPGDTIGVTAPSAGIREEKLENFDVSMNHLRENGYNVQETASVRSGLIASAPGEVRGREFMELVENDEIDMIYCAAGGEFLIEMLPYLNRDCSAYLTGHVTDQIDLGSHTLFVARVIDGKVLNPDPPCTYAYYRSDIKPKPQPEKQVPQWECTVCGYLYEGEEVPDDFICPLCKHGKEDFVKIQ